MSGKKQNCKRHFKKRMKQRYGFTINQKNIKQIVGKIRNGESELVERQSNRVSLHRMKFRGKEITVVYDNNRGVPITVLPERS